MPLPPRRPLKRINNIDSRIFANLIRAQRPLPVKQIAQRTNITWPTANQHIQKLANMNVVKVEKTIRKNRVAIDPRFIQHLKTKKIINKEMDDAWRWLYD